MEEFHKRALRKCQPQLVKEIMLDELLDELTARSVFTDGMMESIKAGEDGRKKIRRLLDDLPRRGKQAFPDFIDCLRNTGQEHLATLILEEEQKLIGVPLGGIIAQPSSHEDQPRYEVRMDVNPGQGYQEAGNRTASLSTYEKKAQSEPSSIYKMESSPRGLCMIINNKHFRTSDEREGTDEDCKGLCNLFQYLGFEVTVKTDLELQAMKENLEAFSKSPDLSAVDSLVLAVLSHGNDNEILCVDQKKIKVREILKYFDNERCPSLIEKPRLMILTACRGEPPTSRQCQIDSVESSVADTADFLIAYSTAEGDLNYRSPHTGTWYIRSLIDVLRKHAADTDVSHMMIKINEKVGNYGADGNAVQIPAPVLSLRKLWYLNPERSSHVYQ